jgi:hypothetical protein
MPSITAGIISGPRFSVGDTGPSGGIIFIIPSTSGNATTQYFEAPFDTWSGGSNDPQYIWGSTAINITSVKFTRAIGDGITNTATIIAADGTASAAIACNNLSLNGFDDWFLPSMGELQVLYNQRALWNDFDTSDNYKSSNQGTAGTFQYNAAIFWSNGTSSEADPKQVARRVRPIRMFVARY